MGSDLKYNRRVDQYSREIFRRAEQLAKDPSLAPAEKQRQIALLEQSQVQKLNRDRQAGRVSVDQFDGGPTALDGAGGELGEIHQAARIAIDLLGTAEGAKKLKQCSLFFTSDAFQNLTLTGAADDGRSVHLRMGTHGGLEGRKDNPTGDGFPFAGNKWVEGDVVVGDKVYSFVDHYTDNFKLDLGPDGRPTAIRFRGEVEVKGLTTQVLTPGSEKWSARLPPTRSEGRALLEMTIPLSATSGNTVNYGLKDFGFEDVNRALSASGGTLTITPSAGGPAQTLKLSKAAGQLETGTYQNVPRAVPAAYRFVQGQQIDTAKVFSRAIAQEPEAVAALLVPGSELQMQVQKLNPGQRPSPELAQRVDKSIRERSGSDPALRRTAAPLVVRYLAGAILPDAIKEQKTSTQFATKLLSEDLASRLISSVADKALDAAGELSADGTYTSYEPGALLDLLEGNPDLVDPVAVLNVNLVPLYLDGRTTPAQLERRTDLLFDERAGKFAIGFQEVFHDR